MRDASRQGGAAVRLIVGVAVLFAVLALAWMLLLPSAIRQLVATRTGFELQMRSLYLNPFTGTLRVEQAALTNPTDFPRPGFLDLRELRLEAKPGSLFRRSWEIDDAIVHLGTVTVVRDDRGRINLWLFAHALGAPVAPPAESSERRRVESRFLIKRLTVRVDRVMVADYARGGQPVVREYDVGFDRTYTNVSDWRSLAQPMAAILERTGVTPDGIAPGTGILLREAGEHLQDVGRKAGHVVKGLIESLEKKLQD